LVDASRELYQVAKDVDRKGRRTVLGDDSDPSRSAVEILCRELG
jgi:hypothetical protein